ncbi:hypothetical protein TeGR_g2894, partial [Tetraparma gracilis]
YSSYNTTNALDCQRLNNWVNWGRDDQFDKIEFVNLGYNVCFSAHKSICLAGPHGLAMTGSANISVLDARLLTTVGVTPAVLAEPGFEELRAIPKDIDTRAVDPKGKSYDPLDVQRTWNLFLALRALLRKALANKPTKAELLIKKTYAPIKAKSVADYEAKLAELEEEEKKKKEEEEEEEEAGGGDMDVEEDL